MNIKMEKRVCPRFEIPGAIVSYKIKRVFSYPPHFDEENCPILDISRGGIRFLFQEELKVKSRGIFSISVPGEEIKVELIGSVRWIMPSPGRSYKYQVGVQFNPYGRKKNQNSRESYNVMIALEDKFAGK